MANIDGDFRATFLTEVGRLLERLDGTLSSEVLDSHRLAELLDQFVDLAEGRNDLVLFMLGVLCRLLPDTVLGFSILMIFGSKLSYSFEEQVPAETLAQKEYRRRQVLRVMRVRRELLHARRAGQREPFPSDAWPALPTEPPAVIRRTEFVVSFLRKSGSTPILGVQMFKRRLQKRTWFVFLPETSLAEVRAKAERVLSSLFGEAPKPSLPACRSGRPKKVVASAA